jgi:hypothetical protein
MQMLFPSTQLLSGLSSFIASDREAVADSNHTPDVKAKWMKRFPQAMNVDAKAQ